MRASQLLDRHRQALREIGERYKSKGITNFRVFGSVATGTDTEHSDIDFLVDAENHVSLLTIGGLYSELEEILNRKIDLVISDEIPHFFREKILNEARSVWQAKL